MTNTERVDARRARTDGDGVLIALTLAALALAVVVRVLIAGDAGARSVAAGASFGVALSVLSGVVGLARPTLRWPTLAWGAGGAIALSLPPLWHRVGHEGAAPGHGFATWAAVVTLVAVAEEVLLRGALFEVVTRHRGENSAVAVGAVAFALLHVPVYGWSVLPLDLAVGVVLGVLRVVSGSVAAPAITHTLADLAGWWLR